MYEDSNCSCITQDNIQWQAVTNMVKKFRFSKQTVIFLKAIHWASKKYPVLCYFYIDLTSCAYIYTHELTLIVDVSSDLKMWLKQKSIYVIKYRVIHKSFRDFRPLRYSSRMVTPKGSMSTEGEKFQVSVLPCRCSICPPLVTRQMSIL